MSKYKTLNIDKKIHSVLKEESGKRLISMKQLVHDAVIEYFERHKVFDSNLDPDTIEKIKVCIEEIYKPEKIKNIWINTLIDKIAKKLELDKYLIEKVVLKLIDNGLLIKDYRDDILYDNSLDERIKFIKNMDGVKD